MEKPAYMSEAERVQAVLNNTGVTFRVDANPDADPDALKSGVLGFARYAFFGSPIRARRGVRQHQSTINRVAEAEGIDAALLSAIVYVEHKYNGDYPGSDWLGISDTDMPANINPEIWGRLIETEEIDTSVVEAIDEDPMINLTAAARLLRALEARVPADGITRKEQVARIASLYGHTGAKEVNDYGAAVADIYEIMVDPVQRDNLLRPPRCRRDRCR